MKRTDKALLWISIRLRQARSEIGQTTAEYALVLLGAAAVAIVLINWAGSDDNGIKEFFQRIMEKLQSKVD
jgi:Flp pilus assembly pilin Flp